MELPFEILLEIALTAPSTWMAMLAIPAVGRWGREHENAVMGRFTRKITRGRIIEWRLPNYKRHSAFDMPSLFIGGGAYWYYNGEYHREGGPAVISKVVAMWYWHGEHHREGGPAIIWFDGRLEWWRCGKRHYDTELSHMTAGELREYGARLWDEYANVARELSQRMYG